MKRECQREPANEPAGGEKSTIQKTVDLLEAAGFHVSKAEEEVRNDYEHTGYIVLRIIPVERLGD